MNESFLPSIVTKCGIAFVPIFRTAFAASEASQLLPYGRASRNHTRNGLPWYTGSCSRERNEYKTASAKKPMLVDPTLTRFCTSAQ